MSAETLRIGLDIGGTKTDAVLVDGAGDIRERLRIATSWGADGVIATALRAIEEVCSSGEVELADVATVGIGVPGQVAAGGFVRHAVNLGVEELALADLLTERVGRPVTVENDVKAAALGAATLLASVGSLAYLNLGTGVAAGHVVDGRLRRGSRGSAGEIGHIPIDPDGHACRCGQRGCIETLVGGAYIAEHWGSPSDYPVLAVFDAADLGDDSALAIRAGLARGVASAVTVLALSIDPGRIVIGGGVTALGERLTDLLRQELVRSAEASDFLRSLDLDSRIELLPRSLPAAAFGAALVAIPD
jgi:predicted NBD/HSP70 family sugar kinase